MPPQPPTPPLTNPAVELDLHSAERMRRSVKFTEDRPRDALPGAGLGIRGIPRPGVYAYLAPGAIFSAASGLLLGSGSVTICSKTVGSGTCVADGPLVTAFNAGGGFTAGSSGMVVKLGWVDGDWSLDVSGC